MTNLRVRELAEKRDMSISDLARDADLAYTTAHALWHDSARMWDRKILDRIALVLGVRVAELFGGEPEKSERRPRARRSTGSGQGVPRLATT
jgi:hypothetical protein